MKKMANAIAPRTATPPTTPPAIAPTGVSLPLLLLDAGRGVGLPVGLDEGELVAVVCDEPDLVVLALTEGDGPVVVADARAGFFAKNVYPVSGASSHQIHLNVELSPIEGSSTWELQYFVCEFVAPGPLPQKLVVSAASMFPLEQSVNIGHTEPRPHLLK